MAYPSYTSADSSGVPRSLTVDALRDAKAAAEVAYWAVLTRLAGPHAGTGSAERITRLIEAAMDRFDKEGG